MSEKEVQIVDEIEPGRLLAEVDAFRSSGWRIVQILCVSSAGGCELTYSFGLALEMRSLRFFAAAETAVPSVTALYPAAFLYENEIRDLFGVRIERIGADWLGKMFDVAGDRPFSKVKIAGPRSEGGSV
jgi:ech hydrogenase subunit D